MNLRRSLLACALALTLPLSGIAQSNTLLLNSFLAPQHPVTSMVIKPWGYALWERMQRMFLLIAIRGAGVCAAGGKKPTLRVASRTIA